MRGAWVPVCRSNELHPEQGVAAVVEGRQVAVFRTHDGDLYAIVGKEPHCGADALLTRGAVGTRGGVPTLASPVHEHVFDLRTGACLDDPRLGVPALPVRVVDGYVEVSA